MKSYSIDQMLAEIGDSIRKLRLQRNLSQGVVAERSGISFGAYRNLELGQGVSLRSFLAVCRTLGKTDWMRTLPPPMISPVEILKHESRPVRQRASAVRKKVENG